MLGELPPGRALTLRGIAAVAVLGYHFTTRYQEQIGHVDGPPANLWIGNYGVYLFFLISGFVIFMTLERTRTAADFVVSSPKDSGSGTDSASGRP